MQSSGKQPKSLEVRVRDTLSGDGTSSARATVFCPGQSRSLDVADCISCDDFVELSLDLEGLGGVLQCHPRTRRVASTSPHGARVKGARSPTDRKLATLADSTRVSALMDSKVRCVRQDVSISALASMLVEGGLSDVLVLNERGEPIGVVSQADLVRYHYASETASRQPSPTAGDIMTAVSVTLHEGASVAQASAVMALEGIQHVPVVDPVGQLVGILSSLDVLYWLACETGYVVDVVRSFLSRH